MNAIKIVSGGQTGVDRAGLDAAIALGLPYGGWVPSGRMAEDGVVPPIYEGMEEYSTPGYPARTKANVRDSDATLILVESLPLSKGTALTLRTAENIRKPHKVVCINAEGAVEETQAWLETFQELSRPLVLNIAGPRESGCPGIQARGKEFLMKVLG